MFNAAIPKLTTVIKRSVVYFVLRTIKRELLWRQLLPSHSCIKLLYPQDFAIDMNSFAQKYGTDKGGLKPSESSIHRYTDFYHILFSGRREEIKSILEFGIGSIDEEVPSNMGPDGRPGASLRMWKEFFPNADIFGVDIDPKTLIHEERIQTRILDQLDSNQLSDFSKEMNREWDLIIDDGLHSQISILNTISAAIDYLSNTGYLIVEDLDESLIHALHEWISSRRDFEGFFVSFSEPSGRSCGGYLLVINRKLSSN